MSMTTTRKMVRGRAEIIFAAAFSSVLAVTLSPALAGDSHKGLANESFQIAYADKKRSKKDTTTTTSGVTVEAGPLIVDLNNPCPAPLPTGTKCVLFANQGPLPLTIHSRQNNTIGEALFPLLGTGSQEYPVAFNDEFSAVFENVEHQKYNYKFRIVNMADMVVEVFGNLPLDQRTTPVTTIDYDTNLAGIDIGVLNPRELATTINKARIFKSFDSASDIDYHINGGEVYTKVGFNYGGVGTGSSSTNGRTTYGKAAFTKSFNANLSTSLSVKGFEANNKKTFNVSSSETESDENFYSYAYDNIHTHSVAVDTDLAPLTDAFTYEGRAIASLADANTFIDKFGTHYSKSVDYGATRSAVSTIDKTTFLQASSRGMTIQNGIEVPVPQSGGEASVGMEWGGGFENTDNHENRAENTSTARYIQGGTQGDGDWQVEVGNSAPVSIDVGQIHELFTQEIFKDGSTTASLSRARGYVQQAIKDRIEDLPGHLASMTPPRIYRIGVEEFRVTKAVDDANSETYGQVIMLDPAMTATPMPDEAIMWLSDPVMTQMPFGTKTVSLVEIYELVRGDLKYREKETHHETPAITASFALLPNSDGEFPSNPTIWIVSTVWDVDTLGAGKNNDKHQKDLEVKLDNLTRANPRANFTIVAEFDNGIAQRGTIETMVYVELVDPHLSQEFSFE